MTDSELFEFMSIFRTLMKVFPKKADEESVTAIGQVYFKALKRFTLGQIQTGADNYAMRGKYFPKPAEWADAIPRLAEGAEISQMSYADSTVWLEAERLRLDGDPCHCAACREASVDHRLVRFVPEETADGRSVRARIGERIVVRGHWAHGYELKRWYAAKEKFWALYTDLLERGKIERTERVRGLRSLEVLPPDLETKIEQAFQPREPGSDG